MKKLRNILNYMLKIIGLFIFVFVFYFMMEYAVHCYASIKVLIYALAGVVLFIAGYRLLSYLSSKRWLNMAMFIFFLLFVIVSLYLNLTCRNNAYSIVDYGFVLDAAEEYADIGEKFDSSYFEHFTVNAFLMLVLSWIIKFCKFIRLQDFYVVFAIIATIMEVITMLSCVFLVYKEKKKVQDAAMTMLLFSAFLPMYALMPFLYTDMLTFGIITLVFSIIYSAYDDNNKCAAYIKFVLAGLILGFGILIKFTIVIQLIAVAIILFVRKKPKRKIGIFIVILSTCAVCVFGNFYVQSREFVKKHSETENPVSAWIATGLSEDGSFAAAYHEFIKEMYTYKTKEGKDEFCKEYIKNNYKKMYDITHIVKKTKRAYGLNAFGVGEYVIEPEVGYEGNWIYKIFSVYEKGYSKMLDFVSAYFGAIILIYILGLVYGIYLLISGKRRAILIDIAELSFVGYFFFQMISETSHHQIFNLMPLVILGSVLNISQLSDIPILLKKQFDSQEL